MLHFFRSKTSANRAKPASDTKTHIEKRRALKASMPQVDLDESHTAGSTILPSGQVLLARIPAGGTACEIGVSRGEFSADIMKINRPKKLHLVDIWESERYAPHFNKVLNRFSAEIILGSVEINRGLSTDVLPTYADSYFDWVYIDRNHSYATTAAELDICKRKVKPGGRIAGHDFCAGNVITLVPYGVMEAYNEFCVRESWRYEFIALDPSGYFSFCLVQIH